MKKMTFLVVLLLSQITIKAQDKKIQFSTGSSLTIPTGAMTLINSMGLGIDFTISKSISEKISAYSTTGFTILGRKTFIGSKTGYAKHIPFLIGAKYSIDKFQFGFGLGYALYNYSKDSDGYKMPAESGFTFRPQVSYLVNEKINFSLNYTNTTTTGLNANYFNIGLQYNLY